VNESFSRLWREFAADKRYRAEFVTAQLKQGIPFQMRRLMKQKGLSQQALASRAGLTQGVVSRAADPEYGNLTLNTIIRIAAGFDVAFIGRFVPFSELANWFLTLSELPEVKSFDEEDLEFRASNASSSELGTPPPSACEAAAGWNPKSAAQRETDQNCRPAPLFELADSDQQQEETDTLRIPPARAQWLVRPEPSQALG
jgi:transcriptional regulator with XRE-family HTH domain